MIEMRNLLEEAREVGLLMEESCPETMGRSGSCVLEWWGRMARLAGGPGMAGEIKGKRPFQPSESDEASLRIHKSKKNHSVRT